MIYWFTGQPGHGKTVLAKRLNEYLKFRSDKLTIHIDGDDLREILANKDYSKAGRENNIRTAQAIARFLQNKSHNVVVSLVAPYRELREEFKSKGNVCEIYVHTTEQRGREHFHMSEYEPPLENFIDIDTTNTTEEQSFEELLRKIQKYGK
jgi:adenylylsulfate kinase